jgi:ATP-dependent Clp protease adapter protein ClpS
MVTKNSDHERPLLEFYDPAKPVPGSVKVATIRGIAVYFHWTLPVGGLLISLVVGFKPIEALYYAIALVSLIAIHELGHIAAAGCLNRKVFALHLHGLGGQCIVQRPTGVRDTLTLYSGGLAAQLLLFIATILAARLIGPPTSAYAMCMYDTFTVVNVFVAILCLLPYQLPDGTHSDGGILWMLFLHVSKGRPHPFPSYDVSQHVFPPATSLLDLEVDGAEDFTTGIQILNDDSTPMEFVVSMLEKHVGMQRDKAIQKMLHVHVKGGLLISLESMALANDIAASITADARAAGHVLACQAIEKIPGALSMQRDRSTPH